MSDAFDYDVFLSYNSKDKKVVHALAEHLKRNGLRVWLDKWEIQPGDMISLKIQHGLEQSRTLVMCMSPAYFDSEWGTLEHHTLLFRDPTNAQHRFIPLLIEDCTRPDIIAQFAYIDWRTPSDEAHQKLVAACRGDEAKTKETPIQGDQAGPEPLVLKGHNSSIVGGEAIAEKIRRFREDRITRIDANETPIDIGIGPKMVLHLIPFNSFKPAQSYDIYNKSLNHEKLRTMQQMPAHFPTHNFDGFLTIDGINGMKSTSYVQLFKNGIIESVSREQFGSGPRNNKQIISSEFEKDLITGLPNYLLFLKELNVDLPIFIFLTFLGVNGYLMDEDTRGLRSIGHPVDRNILLVPEIVIESYDNNAKSALKPCIDSVWNACGYAKSQHKRWANHH